MTGNYLEMENVNKRFKGFTLNNISLVLPKGEIMGLVGANGAGKTTIIKIILNILKQDSGYIRIFGLDNSIAEREIKQNLGVVFDSNFYVDTWSVRDTEKAISVFYDNWEHDIFQSLLKRFKIRSGIKVSELSRGMQMKLMLACAFSHRAKLLILDEPTSGLDPVARNELLEVLREFIKEGDSSVLFSTHITTDLERAATYITCLNNGRLFYTGDYKTLISKYLIINGNIGKLTTEIRDKIIGLKVMDSNFEGLIERRFASICRSCTYTIPTIDDIVVNFYGQQERQMDGENVKIRKWK